MVTRNSILNDGQQRKRIEGKKNTTFGFTVTSNNLKLSDVIIFAILLL